MVGDYVVDAAGKFTERVGLGRKGSNYCPMVPNVIEEGR